MARTANSKACDLCYRRRLKCDAKKPRCSQCIIYEANCTRDAGSRRKKRTNANKKALAVTSSAAQAPETQGQAENQPWGLDSLVDGSDLWINDFVSLRSGPYTALPVFSTGRAPTQGRTAPRLMQLPSKRVVGGLVNTFLNTLNDFMPLYDPATLSHLVNRWYDNSTDRDITSWASINIAMALAQHQSVTDNLEPSGYDVDVCLANVQSVLTEVIMGNLELGSIQVVLGLVMLFQGAPDLRPALVLLSTALRLAQTLRINRKDSYENVTPREALQRTRVFWIAYILDRDISLRCRQPPLQQDAEIDVGLPGDDLSEHPVFSVFRCQIELAQIQGVVYDCLFSVQASHMTNLETANAKSSVVLLLKKWKDRIPQSYSAESLSRDRSTLLPRLFCTLYCRMVTCLGQLSEVNSMDLRWIKRLLSHAQAVASGFPSVPPSSPQDWGLLVTECVSFMNLFLSIRRKNSAFIWTHLCPFTSGLLCLSANSVLKMGSACAEDYERVQADSANFLSDLAEQTNHEVLDKSLEAFRELSWHRTFMKTSRGMLT